MRFARPRDENGLSVAAYSDAQRIFFNFFVNLLGAQPHDVEQLVDEERDDAARQASLNDLIARSVSEVPAQSAIVRVFCERCSE